VIVTKVNHLGYTADYGKPVYNFGDQTVRTARKPRTTYNTSWPIQVIKNTFLQTHIGQEFYGCRFHQSS